MSKPAESRKRHDEDRRVTTSGAGFIVSVLIIAFIGLNPVDVGFGFVFGLFFILTIIAKYKTGLRR